MTFRRLLVPTDLSERSRVTCVYAARFAAGLGAEATYLHVDELAEGGFRDLDDYQDYLSHASDARGAAIDSLRAALVAAGVIAPNIAVVPGRAAEAIEAEATRIGADLVVLARHSRATLEERLVGSTTRRVLRDSSVPVLVVPQHADVPDGVERGPIIAPTDLEDASRQGVAVAVDLARALERELIAVHVIDWPGIADLTRSAPNDLMTRVARRMKLHGLEQLKQHLAAVAVTDDQQRVVSGPSPAEAIITLAASVGASLIALPVSARGPLSRLFLGSTSARLCKLAQRPVLLMPRSWLASTSEGS